MSSRAWGAAPGPSPVERATPVEDWVRDTGFGVWFIATDMWRRRVLQVALADLVRLLGDRLGACRTILDIGCASGAALPMLDAIFSPERLVGIDPDARLVARASREAARCRSEVDLRVGLATALAVPDGSIDLIFCHQTFHHFVDPEAAAREFRRVLRPGGALLLSESCAPFIRSLPVRLLFRHPMDVQREAEEYLRLLESAGFEVGPENVSMPYPWWSRWDLGLRERLGWRPPARRRETLLNVAALRGL